MTNFDVWKERLAPNIEDVVEHFSDITFMYGCSHCPFTQKCEFIDETVCRAKFREWLEEEVG